MGPGSYLKLEPKAGGCFCETLAEGGSVEHGHTRVTMTYPVAGAFTMDSAKLAQAVDQVLATQLGRLRDLASGRPAGH